MNVAQTVKLTAGVTVVALGTYQIVQDQRMKRRNRKALKQADEQAKWSQYVNDALHNTKSA